ncbi:Golgi phosphoprotein 3-domain-containing protein [Mycena olivaceomarginata]|nr:Golgi phosphoprotein 3-domain-containing protein [Mycena olivaceomarginata]
MHHWRCSRESSECIMALFSGKHVRGRLAKGLVDKRVLRTEKHNFLLSDMATHPAADAHVKAGVVKRVVALLTSGTSAVPPSALDAEGTQCRIPRAVCLACAACTDSMLDNAFGRLGYEREADFGRCDEILRKFGVWPFGGGCSRGPPPKTQAAHRDELRGHRHQP